MTFHYLANSLDNLKSNLPDWLFQDLVAGNNGWQIVSFFLSVLAVWVVARFGKAWLSTQSEKADKASTKKVFFSSVGKVLPLLGMWGGARFGLVWVDLGETGGMTETVILTGLEILLNVSVALFAYHMVEVPNSWLVQKTEKTESKFDDMLVPIVRKSLRVTVVLFAFVSIFQTLSDKPLSALVAGLGLGGLAFALAAQDDFESAIGHYRTALKAKAGVCLGSNSNSCWIDC